MDTLDQDVVNLAKAIRQKESGNRAVIPAEGSKLGGASRYQYTHDTWKETARKYLGDPNAPLSLQNENKATYLKIKDWKDKGYNPAQIASMWNAGEGRPNAYKENWKGTNKYGVAYDTPRYVKSVYDEYQKIKGSQPQQRRQPAQPVVPTVAEQRQTLQAQGQPVARNPERVEPTMLGGIIRDTTKGTIGRVLATANSLGNAIRGKDIDEKFKSGYWGDIDRIGAGFDARKGFNKENLSAVKDSVGVGLEMASYIPIAGAVGGTANLVKQGVKLSGKQLATQTAKRLAAKRLGLNVVEGAVGNTLFEGGKKLQGELDRESLGKSALYGAGGGLAFGIGGRALTGVVRGARKTAVALGKGGIPQDLAEEATGKLKGAWNEYINDFKDLTSFRDKYKQKTGTNIEDILTREVITPEIKGNKIDLTESMAKNEAKITSSAENVKGLAKAFNDVPVRLSDLERLAIGVVNDTDSILSSGNIIKARKGVKDLFKGLREAYGENINPEIANDIRLAMNRQTKAFTGSVGEMFEQDIANAVGDAVRTKLDEVIQDDVFRRANAEIGELLNVRKFMNKVNGKNVGGGRFSQAFAGIIGSKILGGANNLPMGFGDIIGYVGGKQLQKQANKFAFGKAGPRTRAILRRLENKSAVGKELAEKTANRKQVLLPARTSPVNKAYGSGKTINLPKKAQSTVDAQEMANLSLQKIKKGDFIEVKGNEVEVTLKTDDGIVVKDGSGKREFISKENLMKGQGEQAFGAVAGLEVDEDGNVKFNKDKALMGVAGMAVAKKAGLIKGAKEVGDNLIQEAKKYKSVDEFVKAQADDYVKSTKEYKDWAKGNKNIIEAYHGTPYSFDKFEIGKKQAGAYELEGISFATKKELAEPFSRQYPDWYYDKKKIIDKRYDGIRDIKDKLDKIERQKKIRSVEKIKEEGKELQDGLQKEWEDKKDWLFNNNFEKFKGRNTYSFGRLKELEAELKRARNIEDIKITQAEKNKLKKYEKELENLDNEVQGNVYKVYIKGKNIIDEIGEEIGFGSTRDGIVANLDGDILRIKDADTGQYVGEEIIVNDPSQIFIVNSPKTKSQLEEIWKKANKQSGLINNKALTTIGGATAGATAIANIPRKGKYQAEKENPLLKKEVSSPKEIEGEFIGTNYDPYDPDQTRPNPTGEGAVKGVTIDETMVAVPRKKDSNESILRLGTVIYVPELNNIFLVADLMNRRFDGMNKIDFARPNKKKTPDEIVNKTFSGIKILREGGGRADTREFVKSGEWEKMRNDFKPVEN